jgi:polyphosphate kinase
MKVHAKLCMITKKVNNRNLMYGFVSTGNLNEKTATVYGDHCLLTANKSIMADVNRMFNYLENPSTKINYLNACKTILPSPFKMREHIIELINREIKHTTLKKKAAITIKVNSLSDEVLIERLYAAAKAGVEIKLIMNPLVDAN